MSLRIFILLVLVILLASMSACGNPSPSLVGTHWQWAAVTTGIDQEPIQNSENYVLIFQKFGTFTGKVDCNQISGTYELTDYGIILSIGPTTLADCGPDSLYADFLGYLKQVGRYYLNDTSLTLYLSDSSAWLEFESGGTVE